MNFWGWRFISFHKVSGVRCALNRGLPHLLGLSKPCPIVVHTEPFSTLVFKVFIWIYICYYHQDLHWQLFNLGSCPKLCYDHHAFLLIETSHHQDLLRQLFHLGLCPKLCHNCHTLLLIKAFHLSIPFFSFFSRWSFLKISCECIRVVQYNITFFFYYDGVFLNALPKQSQFYFLFDVIPMVFGITFSSPSLVARF